MSTMIELRKLWFKLATLSPSGYAAGLHIRFAAALVQSTTYSMDWIEHYTRNAYGLRDPIIAWGLSQEGSIRWSALQTTLPDPFKILDQAKDFGLNYGVAISFGGIESRSIVGIAREDREFTDAEIAELTKVIKQLHKIAEPKVQLTKAQVQALRCIADGDRHAAAAAKLGISESALKARLVSARERLLARTTSEAIQRAKEYRLL